MIWLQMTIRSGFDWNERSPLIAFRRLWIAFAICSTTVRHGRRTRIDGENEVGWEDLLLLPGLPASSLSRKRKGLRAMRSTEEHSEGLHAFRAMHGMARNFSRPGRSI